MRAIRVHEIGGAEVLGVEEIAAPTPGEGEARVKIAAAGVNFIDVYQRTGAYKMPLPFTPGMEGAGVVDAVGAGVTGVKVGDRVAYAMQAGSYAEQAIVPAWKLVPVPDAVELDAAAAVMLQGMTAHYLAFSTFPLAKGQRALVHAAAGGVGLLLTQIAKRLGATVYGTVSTEQKAELARATGADEVIRYDQTDFAEEVRRFTGGEGLDVVYDSVGKDTFDRSMSVLRPRGMMVLYGQSSGAVPPVDPQRLNSGGSLFLTRPTLGHYIASPVELRRRAGDLFDWIASGELKVRIGERHPLEEAGVAHERLTGRKTTGKVLLEIG
ncbi:MAG: quinone oxidoreductase [Gemmatimonadota bacterium]